VTRRGAARRGAQMPHCYVLWRTTFQQRGQRRALSLTMRPGRRLPSDAAVRVIGRYSLVRACDGVCVCVRVRACA
jgi:hypothetical protein